MSAFAGTLRCFERADAPIVAEPSAPLTIDVVSPNRINVLARGDMEYTLDLTSTLNGVSTFSDYGYDGYGGFVELVIPMGSPERNILAEFRTQTCSEAGCQPSRVELISCSRSAE